MFIKGKKKEGKKGEKKKREKRKAARDLFHRNEWWNREIWFHLWKKLKRYFFFSLSLSLSSFSLRRSLFLLKRAGSLEFTDNKSSISRSIFTLAKHPPQSFCSYSWIKEKKERERERERVKTSLVLNPA